MLTCPLLPSTGVNCVFVSSDSMLYTTSIQLNWPCPYCWLSQLCWRALHKTWVWCLCLARGPWCWNNSHGSKWNNTSSSNSFEEILTDLDFFVHDILTYNDASVLSMLHDTETWNSNYTKTIKLNTLTTYWATVTLTILVFKELIV